MLGLFNFGLAATDLNAVADETIPKKCYDNRSELQQHCIEQCTHTCYVEGGSLTRE